MDMDDLIVGVVVLCGLFVVDVEVVVLCGLNGLYFVSV